MSEMTGKPRIRINVDSEIQKLVPQFLENRKRDCELILQLVEQKEFEKIYSLAHNMKGTGAGYGFDFITEQGEAMERAALSPNPGEIRKRVSSLQDYLDRLEVVYT